MEIEVNHSAGTEYIVFEGVEYFAGPMFWQNANFSIADCKAGVHLLRKLARYQDIPDEYLEARFYLFVAGTNDDLNGESYVTVLARKGCKSQNPSGFF